MKYADLHIHTNYSDGSFTPAEIVELAYKKGITTIAITDHDNMVGISEAKKAANKYNIEIIRGIEVSTSACHQKMHILGYFCNPLAEPMRSVIRDIRDRRYQRIHAICDKLNILGIEINCEKEFQKSNLHSYERSQLAMIMKDLGYVKSIEEAFERYIGEGKPAFIDKWAPDPFDVVEMIHKAEGLAVLAHPGIIGDEIDEFLPKLIECGLDGIEVFYPMHTDQHTAFYRKISTENTLVMTGGSDYHGNQSDSHIFGIFKIKNSYVEALKARKNKKFPPRFLD